MEKVQLKIKNNSTEVVYGLEKMNDGGENFAFISEDCTKSELFNGIQLLNYTIIQGDVEKPYVLDINSLELVRYTGVTPS